jgi:hypothetical protein
MIPAGMRDFEAAAARAYAEGRREQRCPDCGREEAGGSYCTACSRPMHPDDWTNDTAASRAGRANRASRGVRSPIRAAMAANREKGTQLPPPAATAA